jgi:Uma2 family endonuclease
MPVSTLPQLSANGSLLDVPSDLIIWRLSVDHYHAMIRAGILMDDDPVELLEGWLVQKMPKNPSHRRATRRTQRALDRILPEGWYTDAQEPITTDTSEPEPDVVVARGDTDQYPDRHPGPQDLALVTEVANTTLQRDRGSKKRIYARAGVPVYWIVNLTENQVEVYTAPSGPAERPDYGQRRNYGPSDEVPVVIDGREVGRIPVRDLLP